VIIQESVRRIVLTNCLVLFICSVQSGRQLLTAGGGDGLTVNLSADYLPVKCQNGEMIRENRLSRNAEVSAMSDPYDTHHVIAAWVGGQGIITVTSFDGGQSWNVPRPLPLTACLNAKFSEFKGGADEWIAIGVDRTVYISALVGYRTIDRQALVVGTSKDGGVTWEDPVVVVNDRKMNTDIDNTSIVADSKIPGYAYVATESIHDGSTSSVGFSRTTDGGRTWSPIREITTVDQGRRFPSPQLLIEGRSNRLYAFSKVQKSGQNWIAGVHSDDRGVSWSGPERIANCVPPRSETKLGAASIAFESAQDMLKVAEDQRSGTIYIAFSDARVTNGGYLGVSLVSSSNRGQTWNEPVSVNTSSGGHAFQPAVAVNFEGEVGVSYYDTRGGFPEQPGKTLPIGLWLQIIRRGKHVTELRLDQFNYAGLERRALLDYQALVAIEGRFHAVYTKSNLRPDQTPTPGLNGNVTDIYFH
jgi:hypothetical protein